MILSLNRLQKSIEGISRFYPEEDDRSLQLILNLYNELEIPYRYLVGLMIVILGPLRGCWQSYDNDILLEFNNTKVSLIYIPGFESRIYGNLLFLSMTKYQFEFLKPIMLKLKIS